jgi:SAM-dependent methyltransferase
MKQCWPAPERNKDPILEVLKTVLAEKGEALEIASGSGQHAVHFARHLPDWTWQPSDVAEETLASVKAWVSDEGLTNLVHPLRLDVCSDDWGVGVFDAIFCANMIHIAPWACTLGLLAGAGRHLKAGGHLILYGPYRIHGAHTAESNAAFDANLRARDAEWGVRDLDEVVEIASRHGLSWVERFAMPANNQTVVLDKEISESTA